MKKFLSLLIIIFIFSCISTKIDQKIELPPIPPPPQIIDYLGKDQGKKIPSWITNREEELNKSSEKYMIVVSKNFISMDKLIKWRNSLNVLKEIIYSLSIFPLINSKYGINIYKDNIITEYFFENFFNYLDYEAKIEYEMSDEIWIQKRYFKPNKMIDVEQYEYYIMVTFEKTHFDIAFKSACDYAISRIKELNSEGIKR